MPPEDTTPHGGEVMHSPPQRARIPDPPPDSQRQQTADRSDATPLPDPQEIARRPALPEHPVQMAADIEDEEADPVVDSGPGIDDAGGGGKGVVSVTRQPGG